MGRLRPTLKDVADAAGVSFKTVSRVVNGEPGVSADLTERVNTAVAELGYRRNHSAHMLRRADQRAGTIGVVHADIANPFAAAVHAAFERAASGSDTLLLSGSAGEDPDRQDALVEAFMARQVDGLVVIPSGPRPGPALARELRRKTPIVFVDREPGVDADVVASDHHTGAHQATRHLVHHGHRHIVFLGSRQRTSSTRDRRRGFDEAMATVAGGESTVRTDLAGADQAEAAVRAIFAGEAGQRAGRAGDPRFPSAIFAAQNLTAMGAVRALHKLGLHRDIALVAFDHLEIADIVEPGITTVPQDAGALGSRAAELLFDRIDGSRGPAIRHIEPLRLMPRGSGELRAR